MSGAGDRASVGGDPGRSNQGRPGAAPALPEADTAIERLVDERVRVTNELCRLAWRQQELELAIRRELSRCTSSEPAQAELLRQCMARAWARTRCAPTSSDTGTSEAEA